MSTKSSSTIWVMVVDDDPTVLSSLRTYFSSTRDIRVLAEARNGVDALEQLRHVDVDIVLADIHMPEMDGVTLLHEIRALDNPPFFVAITALDTDETMLEVLAGGGAGYIVKSSRPQTIIAAIRDAVAGGTTVSPHALKLLVGHLPGDKLPAQRDSRDSVLTESRVTKTEKKVLKHLCDGKSNAEISEALNLSESTVKKQVSNLIGEFGVNSRLQLAVSVIRSGYLDA